jgi:hypothetical protein
MYPSMWKVLAVAVVSVAALAFAAGRWSGPALAEKPPAPAPGAERKPAEGAQAKSLRQLESARWYVLAVDPKKRLIEFVDTPVPLHTPADSGWPSWPLLHAQLALSSLTVAEDATITVEGKKARLEDVKTGMSASVRFAGDRPVVERIDARGGRHAQVLKAVDAERSTITVAVGAGGELTELPVARNLLVFFYPEGKRGKLEELKPGMPVALQLRLEEGRLVVGDIWASE